MNGEEGSERTPHELRSVRRLSSCSHLISQCKGRSENRSLEMTRFTKLICVADVK